MVLKGGTVNIYNETNSVQRRFLSRLGVGGGGGPAAVDGQFTVWFTVNCPAPVNYRRQNMRTDSVPLGWLEWEKVVTQAGM